ncbi:MAG: serine/threonine protein kinase [Deltaproteobacteria bacterium]|nr:serine/threonine protein kinase [Deltaproteobacteria bacterium]
MTLTPSSSQSLAPQPSIQSTSTNGFPREFGRYTLVQGLAQGGMGVVYLAWGGTEEAPTQCVLKTVRPGFNGPDAKTRFLDEARISAKLRHNNICSVFDVGEVQAEFYMAMEYMGRITLRKLHDRARRLKQPVSIELAIWMACEILNGLHYAHAQKDDDGKSLNIVHRDVSPQNVMLTSNGEVKLIDFGLAYSEDKVEKSEAGATQGKIQYMAPEQVKALPIDHRTDQFAVAMLVYELVVGERYYEGTAGSHEIWQVAGGGFRPRKWSLFEEMALELATYTKKALSEKPEDRWEDCLAFKKSLQRFVTGFSRAQVDSHDVKTLLHELWPTLEEDDRTYLQSLPKPNAPLQSNSKNSKVEPSGHTLTEFEKRFDPAASQEAVEKTTTLVSTLPLRQPKPEKSKAPLFIAFAALVIIGLLGGTTWKLTHSEKEKPEPEIVTSSKVPVAEVKKKTPDELSKKKEAKKQPGVQPLKKSSTKTKAANANKKKTKVSSASTSKKKTHKKKKVAPKRIETEKPRIEIVEVEPKKAPVLSKLDKMRVALKQCQNSCAPMWLRKLQGKNKIDGGISILVGRCIQKCK